MIKKIELKELIPIIIETIANDKTISFTPSGDSMLPTIDNKKDIVVLSKANTFKKYDILLFEHQGKYILHRLVKIKNNCYYFCGDHNILLEGPIEKENIIAKISSYNHKGKEIKINTLFYLKGKMLFLTRRIRTILRRLFHA